MADDKPRQCFNASGTTKRTYDFRSQSRAAARLNSKKTGERYEDYRCKNCGGLHIGRSGQKGQAY